MKQIQQPKLSDIAKYLKVSSVTVSKALRDHPDISERTARKIKATAKKFGYIPNYLARSLASNRSNTIGVVVPKIEHFFFSAIIEEMYKVAFENNYEIILMVSQENAQLEVKHIESLLAMQVDGIAISITQNTENTSVFKKVIKSGIPLTFMDRVLELDGANTVVGDDEGGSYTALEHAINLGYKTFAMIGGRSIINIVEKRLLGYKKALRHYGIHANSSVVVSGGLGEEDGYKGFMKLYSSDYIPQCIFTVTFPVALGVYSAAQELGLRIPTDFDIISYGCSPINKFLHPRLSYIEQPAYSLGRAALEITLRNIQNRDSFVPRHMKLPTRLVLEETCKSKAKKKRRK